jgi:hypothetical protein
MSYDLYFYKQKGRQLSEKEIGDYLNEHLTVPTEGGNQWFFQNEDTQVYFFVNHNEPEDDPEAVELFESFADFDNTHYTLNLNFLRPNFFGLEAFRFVDKFITDLDLFVLNPQSQTDPDNPLKEAVECTCTLEASSGGESRRISFAGVQLPLLDLIRLDMT